MPFLKRSLAVCFLLLISINSWGARYFDGAQALAMCQSDKIEMSAGCSMFLVGTAEAFRMVGYSGVRYCLPQDVTNIQLRQQFINYLNQHSNTLAYSATSLFYAALLQNNAC